MRELACAGDGGAALKAMPQAKISVILPAVPVLTVEAEAAWVLSPDGEIAKHSIKQAVSFLHKQAVIVCHAPYTRGRLGENAHIQALDVLELFAFVHPGMFCVPTPAGLCKALGLSPPSQGEDQPAALLSCAAALLKDLRQDTHAAKADPLKIAAVMGQNGKGWPWAASVFSALGQVYDPKETVDPRAALRIWKHLPEWSEDPPAPPPAHHGVSETESLARLQKLLRADAEERPEQKEYAAAMAGAFAPVNDSDAPPVVLLEAGTGIGKTLGYLAPASVWAEKNDGAVWISTFTKNLQRQIESELDKLYPDPALKNAHVAVRKGRENYLCLLNLEELGLGAITARHADQAVAAGIMTRWAAASKDGDLTGADFPGWLTGLLGQRLSVGLADRRGECLYSACDHYKKCFVERSIRKSKRARIVVANHALVMIQAALNAPGQGGDNPLENMPSRYVFDEAHHVFDAADSAFAAHLTAWETQDLRRWLRGAEGGPRTRARGLQKRAESLIAGDEEAEKALQDVLHHAGALTADGWLKRLEEGEPKGPAEQFLLAVARQIKIRAEGQNGPYSIETQTFPLTPEVAAAIPSLHRALEDLRQPMQRLNAIFRRRLAEDEGLMDPDTRRRLDAVCTSLERRFGVTIKAWQAMLDNLQSGTQAEGVVDWMEIEREGGKMADVGLYRHFLDPMQPFAAAMRPHMQGAGMTSATLRDFRGQDDDGWASARARTGADALSSQVLCKALDSPFDYAAQSRIFIINDVRKDDLGQVGGAVRALFAASGGGALGLFTAISRLKAVREQVQGKLEQDGIHLYAQHVDNMDAGTLVDIFRDDVKACLLGTDAVRDGVDVPGESLRLIVFDRVPWPRPTILHAARKAAFGKKEYDDMITRLKLKQAFGRLIRRASDKGVFVMLDPMLPSRLLTAFPEGAPVVKCGLTEAVKGIKDFL